MGMISAWRLARIIVLTLLVYILTYTYVYTLHTLHYSSVRLYPVLDVLDGNNGEHWTSSSAFIYSAGSAGYSALYMRGRYGDERISEDPSQRKVIA
jgi:hypothetical protein